MEEYKEIERSIIKKFRKDIWSKFVKAVADYELINEKNEIVLDQPSNLVSIFKKFEKILQV